MTIDKKYIDKFINVTSKAAIASSHLVGKNDKIAADQAAVDEMRNELNKIEMLLHDAGQSGTMSITPLYSTDDVTYNLLEINSNKIHLLILTFNFEGFFIFLKLHLFCNKKLFAFHILFKKFL